MAGCATRSGRHLRSRSRAASPASRMPGSGWQRRSETGFAGVACLLTTPADTPADWVAAGHALQRILLTSASYGVAAALYSQPVEVGWLREITRAQLGDGSWPQLVFRLGTVIQSAISGRRPLSRVLITADGK